MTHLTHCARCGLERTQLATLELAGSGLELVPDAYREDQEEPYRLALDAHGCPGCGALALHTAELDYLESLSESLGVPTEERCPTCADALQLDMMMQDSPYLTRQGSEAGGLRSIVCRACGWTRLRVASGVALEGAASTESTGCDCGAPALGPFGVAVRGLFDDAGGEVSTRQVTLVAQWGYEDDPCEVRAAACTKCRALELYATPPEE